jgi:hypothetical protein
MAKPADHAMFTQPLQKFLQRLGLQTQINKLGGQHML